MVDDLHVLDAGHGCVDKLPPRHGGVVHPVAARLGIAPVDELIAAELRIEHHVEQPALSSRIDLGQTNSGHRERTIGGQHAQTPGTFRNQQLATRQKGHAPRILKPLRQRHLIERHAERLLRGARLPRKRGRLSGPVRGPGINALPGRDGHRRQQQTNQQ